MSASPAFREALGLALAFTAHREGCPMRGPDRGTECTCGLSAVRAHGYHLIHTDGWRDPDSINRRRAWTDGVRAARALRGAALDRP